MTDFQWDVIECILGFSLVVIVAAMSIIAPVSSDRRDKWN
jgi:hypothetical protein